jgi:hypothetical protein
MPLPGIELRPLGRPARSQSLYRMHFKRQRSLSLNHVTMKVPECFPSMQESCYKPKSGTSIYC